MRVGIFLVMVGRAAAGPETYELRLVRALAAIDHETEYHVFCLDTAAVQALGINQPNFVLHVLSPANRWLSVSLSLPLAIRRYKVELLHATFTPPPFSPVDYLFTMHGAVTFSHPHFYSPLVRARLNTLLRRGITKSRLIVCVSEFVKQELIERFDVPDERLITVYHGVGDEFRHFPAELAQHEVARNYQLTRPYYLYVGKLHANKNIVRLVEAFHAFITDTGADHLLVLAGRLVWGSEGIMATVARLDLDERVRFIGHRTQAELPALYNAATAFVFPTLWEGFGLPVVEAMACGTPVIASDIACIPEVTGGAALLVNPLSTAALAQAMTDIYNDSELREGLRTCGIMRARCFDWHHTATATLDAYRRIHDLGAR